MQPARSKGANEEEETRIFPREHAREKANLRSDSVCICARGRRGGLNPPVRLLSLTRI